MHQIFSFFTIALSKHFVTWSCSNKFQANQASNISETNAFFVKEFVKTMFYLLIEL